MKRHGYQPKRTGKTPRIPPSGGTNYAAVFIGTPRTADGGADGILTAAQTGVVQQAHNHYYKSVEGLRFVDVYRVLQLFAVTDPCLQHAVKKLLVAGGRGAGKDISRDVQEAIDSLKRWQEMRREEQPK